MKTINLKLIMVLSLLVSGCSRENNDDAAMRALN